MRWTVCVGVVLVAVATVAIAVGQEEDTPASRHVDADYGLRPEDAAQIERMLEEGEAPSVSSESTQIGSAQFSDSHSSTTSVPLVSLDWWFLGIVAASLMFAGFVVLCVFLARKTASSDDSPSN